MVEKFDTSNEDSVKCPWCGYDNGYDDIYEDDDNFKCDECDKLFSLTVESRMYYSTKSDCIQNKEKHNWGEWEYFDHESEYNVSGRCKGRKKECLNCNESVYEFDKN